jgi:hypothetical protein
MAPRHPNIVILSLSKGGHRDHPGRLATTVVILSLSKGGYRDLLSAPRHDHLSS